MAPKMRALSAVCAVFVACVSNAASAEPPVSRARLPAAHAPAPALTSARPPPPVTQAPAVVKIHPLQAVGHAIKNVAVQAGGLAVGFGEKALGRHSPDVSGAFQPIEVRDPSGSRQLVVFRSDQAKSVSDIASFVDLARERGATNRSQILFVNLRSEKDEDASLIAQYQASLGRASASTRIKQLDVKIIDNAPPAFYAGSLGWKKAVDQVRQVYTAMKDPSVKVAVIHCEEGHGRTGEIVATAVRIAMDGMSAQDALAEAEQHGLVMPWQRAFIERFAREWHEGKIDFN